MDDVVVVENISSVTRIYFVLDRSGSMNECIDDTIGGFNSFIERQLEGKANDHVLFSLYQFDDQYECVYENQEKPDALTRETFIPRGFTALYDAIGLTVSKINPSPDDTVIIVILTDGKENSSREFKSETIRSLITEKREKGWEFVFLGANQDACLSAKGLGIAHDSAMTYAQKGPQTQRTYECLSQAIMGHRQRRSAGMKSNVAFTKQDRKVCIDDVIDQ